MLECVFRAGDFRVQEDSVDLMTFSAFEISGHAGYGEEGSDVVCAGVSSCTMLVCNCITESFKANADVTVEENRITLRILEYDEPSVRLLSAFYQHLKVLSEDYRKIKLTII